MATLTANISANTPLATLSAPVSATPGALFRLGSEMVRFLGYQTPVDPRLLNRAKVIIERGVRGTARASHNTGVTLDGPFEGTLTADEEAALDGAASPSASNVFATVADLPSPAPPDLSGDTGTATAPPSITFEGSGGASVAVTQAGGAGTAATVEITAGGGGFDYVQDADPGAVGGGKTWIQLPPLLAPPVWSPAALWPGNAAQAVVPIVPNGHWYHSLDAGFTGETEPTWPTNGGMIVDGDLTWTDEGLLEDVSIPVGHLRLWRRNADDSGWTEIASGDAVAVGSAPGTLTEHHYSWGSNGVPFADWAVGIDPAGGSMSLYVLSADLGKMSSWAIGVGVQEFVVADEPQGIVTVLGIVPTGVTINGNPVGTQAADVGAGGTPEQIIAALRASGLMAQTAVALVFAQDPTAALTNAVITPAVTVQLLDDLGNVCMHDSATAITVALTTPGGATLGGTLTRMCVAGIATFDDLNVDTAGTGYTLDATSGALTPDTSASFDITAPGA